MNWVLLANSFLVAGLSAFLALLIGLGVALALTVLPKVPRYLLLACSIAVLALPSFLVTNCWIDLLGVNGALSPWR
jgi:ABC-type Fe3+ transport system permease subunit